MKWNEAAVALTLDNYKHLPELHIKLSTKETAAALNQALTEHSSW